MWWENRLGSRYFWRATPIVRVRRRFGAAAVGPTAHTVLSGVATAILVNAALCVAIAVRLGAFLRLRHDRGTVASDNAAAVTAIPPSTRKACA
jgi:hypothetical protein